MVYYSVLSQNTAKHAIGLPISLKDQLNIKGIESTLGTDCPI